MDDEEPEVGVVVVATEAAVIVAEEGREKF